VRKLPEGKRCIIVVRIRGNVGTSREIEEVLRQMHLTRKNHATLILDSTSSEGVLRKVKDYTTWGEASPETIIEILEKRGMLFGNTRLTEDYVKTSLGYESLAALASDLHEGRADLRNLKGVKPLFRLHPPSKGFHGSTKKPYPEGELGYRGEEINALLIRMV
jgi:large subunit ribosomal protein L30